MAYRAALKLVTPFLAAILLLLIIEATTALADRPQRVPGSGLPTPNPDSEDRLAVPVLPENPTQEELGESVYYYNCMPCHGDRGQGLTDEFREIWVEDHQNCWGRGCHAGRIGDEGFPIPRSIPAVNNSGLLLRQYPNPQSLFVYLQTTHPPQNPGGLSDLDYWSVTAFIFEENGAPLRTNSNYHQPSRAQLASLGIFIAAAGLCAGAIILQIRQEKQGND